MGLGLFLEVAMGLQELHRLAIRLLGDLAAGHEVVHEHLEREEGDQVDALSAQPLPPARPVQVFEIGRSAADVPAPITRTSPQEVHVFLETREVVAVIDPEQKFRFETGR